LEFDEDLTTTKLNASMLNSFTNLAVNSLRLN